MPLPMIARAMSTRIRGQNGQGFRRSSVRRVRTEMPYCRARAVRLQLEESARYMGAIETAAIQKCLLRSGPRIVTHLTADGPMCPVGGDGEMLEPSMYFVDFSREERSTEAECWREAAHENEPRLAVPSCHGRR